MIYIPAHEPPLPLHAVVGAHDTGKIAVVGDLNRNCPERRVDLQPVFDAAYLFDRALEDPPQQRMAGGRPQNA
jgi:hypothetical protein